MTDPHPNDQEATIADEQAPMPEPGTGADEQKTGVADMVRRALMAGVGAVFMTEEGIRRSVQELKLPKEAFAYVAGQAEKTRSEAGRIFRKEIRRFLNSEAFRQQLTQMVSGLTLEVKAEIRLKPALEGDPDLKTKVRVKASPKEPQKP